MYSTHVFVCTNQKEKGHCCANHNSADVHAYLKEQTKKLGLSGPGQTRINLAGCLGRCKLGPVMVVYPEGTWYSYKTHKDVDDILSEHIQNGRIVERLLLETHGKDQQK